MKRLIPVDNDRSEAISEYLRGLENWGELDETHRENFVFSNLRSGWRVGGWVGGGGERKREMGEIHIIM